tara:strand:+ start:448 stop:897 length:450 start_codon:yes stop_codon:yes gene_type:complete
MDKLLGGLRTSADLSTKANRLQQKQIENMVAKAGKESAELIDSVTKASARGVSNITKPGGFGRKADELQDKLKDLERLNEILGAQMKMTENFTQAQRLMTQINEVNRIKELLRATIVAAGAGATGAYVGTNSEADEAVGNMDNTVNGRE